MHTKLNVVYLAAILSLSACANKEPYKPYITLEQLRQMQVTQADCKDIEELIPKLELQQANAGIPRSNPEDLTPIQREYQARIRSAVWALRIGCSNPNRYDG
jgi:hypothetical protein